MKLLTVAMIGPKVKLLAIGKRLDDVDLVTRFLLLTLEVDHLIGPL